MNYFHQRGRAEMEQEMLRELCVAEFAQSYCAACASGSGCCVPDHSDEDLIPDDEGFDAGMIEPEEYGEEVEEEEEEEERVGLCEERKIRRQKLTIDLNNDENLTDGEILMRLLSPIESPLSDEPLEVILEIVDEEGDDSDDVEETSNKTFKSLRKKIRQITATKPSEEVTVSSSHWKRQLRKIKKELQYSCKEDRPKSFSSSFQMCPSFHKANNLINEIEKCFMETATLVEKTLESSKDQGSHLTDTQSNPLEYQSDNAKHFTSTVEEALNIFDSLLNDHKNRGKTQLDFHSNIANNNSFTANNVSNDNYKSTYDIGHYDQRNYGGINRENENWFSHISKQRIYTSSFEKDIDDLFKECYQISSVEPSTSLPACLKNLESLCIQLNRAKENILLEMKNEYRRDYQNDNYDMYGSQASSLDSQECLSIINELIDKKLKEKLKRKKFNFDPPMMGLEGKTHKRIAEVFPSKLYIENEMYANKENDGLDYYYRGNSNKLNDFSPNNMVDTLYGGTFEQSDFNSESPSEMSTTTNTLDSSRYFSSSSNTTYSRNEENSKYSYSETSDDGQNQIMSYEETLALYEDNQELQKSLLSILHSLNDIHDNFLNRRRLEMALSQRNSDFIQNHLRSEINSNAYRIDNTAIPNLITSPSYTNKVAFDKAFEIKRPDDCESIQKINRVSDELKNLWLYATQDLKLKTRRPTRSSSLNRGTKRYKQLSDFYEESNSDEYDYLENINEKSLSLPNLTLMQNEAFEAQSSPMNSSSKVSPTQNFFVENFVKQMKKENGKCYEVTRNFLESIIETSPTKHEGNTARGGFVPTTEQLQNYNAFLRTY